MYYKVKEFHYQRKIGLGSSSQLKLFPPKTFIKRIVQYLRLTNIFRACREYIDENLSINHSVPVMEITTGVQTSFFSIASNWKKKQTSIIRLEFRLNSLIFTTYILGYLNNRLKSKNKCHIQDMIISIILVGFFFETDFIFLTCR